MIYTYVIYMFYNLNFYQNLKYHYRIKTSMEILTVLSSLKLKYGKESNKDQRDWIYKIMQTFSFV